MYVFQPITAFSQRAFPPVLQLFAGWMSRLESEMAFASTPLTVLRIL